MSSEVEATEEGLAGEERATLGEPIPQIRALTDTVLQLLPVDGVAVGIRSGPDTARLVHATDPVVALLDELQFTLGEGPTVDAYRHRFPVLVPDLTSANTFQRWPGFAPEATAAGAGATFAFPLQIASVPFGTVELYRRAPGWLTGQEITTALLIIDNIAGAVLDELGGPDLPATGEPDSRFGRAEIPQATGMVAVQLGVTIPEALVQLRAAAFAAQRPVLRVAQDVIARRITFAGDQQ